MLQYLPILGSILLTVIILWVGISTYVGNRRKIGDALAGRSYCVIPGGNLIMPEARRSLCCHSETFSPRWTADGWVAACAMCGTWQYLGDDYEHPPEDAIVGFAGIIDLRPEVTSDEAVRLRDEYRQAHPDIAAEWDQAVINAGLSIAIDDDQGEPLPASMTSTPNVGGEGNPDYQGPHYEVEHERFVPYDVIGDPFPGAAVHFIGNDAMTGPLEDEPLQGEDDAISDDNDSR